jgi:hypothetical protein
LAYLTRHKEIFLFHFLFSPNDLSVTNPFRAKALFIFIFLLASIFLVPLSHAVATESCRELFVNVVDLSEQTLDLQTAQDISVQVSEQVEVELAKTGFKDPQKRGYAILIGSMVGSAALTTYLGSHLGSELQFLSIFLAQVSTLGVYVIGAPIWEPISSKFRQIAFGVGKDSSLQETNRNPVLESTWLRTQEHYSLNAQMSRNVISQFVVSVRQNFYEAQRALKSNDQNFAVDQIAEAAFRLRILFRDIRPDDVSVAAAVNSAFTNHVELDGKFVELVWRKLEELDPHFQTTDSRTYYSQTLQSWLKISASEIPE